MMKYLKEFNQLGLIGSSELERWVKGGAGDAGNIMESVSKYIDRVDSSSGSDVILGVAIRI